jgi:transcriptional regulator with XRE-family HTH domain
MPVYDSHLRNYSELKIGQRIRAQRLHQGMTLRDVCKKTAISVARLSEIENERHIVDMEQTVAIATALSVAPSSLVPSDVCLPYQITRDADLRSRAPIELRLARIQNRGAVTHHNVFWPLADHFVGRHMEPVLGRIMPVPDGQLQFCFHDQVEFVFGLKGTIEFLMKTPEGLRREVLDRGDCVFFQSKFPHSLRSLDPDPAEAIHVFSSGAAPIESAFASLSSHPVVYVDHEAKDGWLQFVGERVRVLRDAQGSTVEQIASLVGLSPRQLLQIENGTRAAQLDVMLGLARAFGRPLHEFLHHTEELGPFYHITRSSDVAAIPSRRRRTPVERPSAPRSKTCQPLADNFPTRGVFPYFIRLLNVDVETLTLHEHHGHEFIYVLDGQLELTTYAGDSQVKETLGTGDCIYIDSSVPHLLRGYTRNPYSDTSATVLDVFWCHLGEAYLFE